MGDAPQSDAPLPNGQSDAPPLDGQTTAPPAPSRWPRIWLTSHPWLALLAAVAGATVAATHHNLVGLGLSGVGMVLATGWLHRRSRHRGDGDARWPHVLIAAVALALGLVGMAGPQRWLGATAEWLFFGGLTLTVVGGGALLSEWRHAQGLAGRTISRVLYAVSLALLLGALAVPAQWIALAAALVAAELATELTSERAHRRAAEVGKLDARAIVGIVAGLATVLVGFGWMLRQGASTGHAGLVVGLLLVLVVMAALDNDALLIAVAGAVVLLWATAPPSDDLPDTRIARPGEPYFVVLGDSYISGEGAETFFRGTNTKTIEPGAKSTHENECRRSTASWPVLFSGPAPEGQPEVDVPEDMLFLACSGAVTENIHTEPRQDEDGVHGPAELRLAADRSSRLDTPAFVLLSIGGNDAGFGEIGRTCVGPGDCTAVAQQFLDDPRRQDDPQPVEGPPGPGRPESLAHIVDDLDAAYQRVSEQFGEDVPVIVVPYPRPITDEGPCEVLLTGPERRFVNRFVVELNDVIEAAAARHGFWYLDGVETALEREGSLLCSEDGIAGINFIEPNPTGGSIRDRLLPTNWTHNSLHPNEAGHRAIAAEARRWFADHPSLDPPARDPDRSHQVRSLTEIMGREVEQCGASADCGISDHRWLIGQVHTAYREALPALVLLAVGLWHIAMPALVWLRRRVS